MKLIRVLLIASFVLTVAGLCAQAIDNTASFRSMEAPQYLRLHYENDFFSAEDLYYSQGISLEWVSPAVSKLFLSRTLLSANDEKRYGISIEHDGYTPSSTSSEDILYGDRPYAATLLFKTSSASNNLDKRFRVNSTLSLGVIGPAAGGHAMQSTIHRWINDSQPLGWDNQIQNDVVVNYEAGLEKNFISGNGFLINGFASGRLGTLNTKLSSGFVMMAGRMQQHLNTAFSRKPAGVRHIFNFHFYFQPMVNLVGYDATLQGGMFNRSSPYTIPADAMERLTFQANGGLVLTFPSLYLEYSQTVLSKEFETGLSHQWGGLRIGFRL